MLGVECDNNDVTGLETESNDVSFTVAVVVVVVAVKVDNALDEFPATLSMVAFVEFVARVVVVVVVADVIEF